VGWVHKSGEDWYMYDDDIVTMTTTEEILALKGGGDWHTAYMNLYRKVEAYKN
jgi:ubiquitin carboxyl-terminal hydrolase 14